MNVSSEAVVFKILTWNLAMLETSAQAPTGWNAEYTEDAIRRFILRSQPHWVFFQEIPDLVPFVEGYTLVPQQTESHCGKVVTLMHDDLAELPISHSVVERCGVLSRLRGLDTTIANVHLAPGSSGHIMRNGMLQRVSAATETSRLLVVGDTNTRLTEESKIRKLGFECERPPVATWDSRVNRFRPKMRGYTAYYTRYFSHGNIRMSNADVHNKPMHVDGKRFFLSDHFALSAQLTIPIDGGSSI